MLRIVEANATVMMFEAPDYKYLAQSLWCYLAENLRPGLVVELSSDSGASEITRVTGRAVPTALYESLMEGAKKSRAGPWSAR